MKTKSTKTQRRLEKLQKLNMLERKHKFQDHWDHDVKIAFHTTQSMSFEDLIYNDESIADSLIAKYK